MKRSILSLLATIISIIANGQAVSGTWDAKTATYINKSHHIVWHIMEDIDWVARPVLSNTTLFKAKDEESGIMVTLGCHRNNTPGSDVWDMLPEYDKKEFVDMLKAQAKEMGLTYKSKKTSRSQICGKHATKITTDMTQYHPQYNVTTHAMNTIYQVANGEYIYTLNILATTLREEDVPLFDKIVASLIKGFSFN